MKTRMLLLSLMLVVSYGVQAKQKGISVPDAFFAPGHDHSFLVERYALDNAGKWNALRKFVAKETKGFDKLTMSLYPDSAKDGNNVLILCMKFYESEKLDKFAHNLFK